MQTTGWIQPRVVGDEIWVDQPYSRSIQVVHPDKGVLREIEIPFGGEEKFDFKKFNRMVSERRGFDADEFFTNACRLNDQVWVTRHYVVRVEKAVGQYPRVGVYDLAGVLLGRTRLMDYGNEDGIGHPIGVKGDMLVFNREGVDEGAPTLTFAAIKLDK